jgi:hypothetical protein
MPRLLGTAGPGRTISLVDAQRRRVKSLHPGMYRFVIRDRSIHENFHLSGPNIGGLAGVTGIRFRGTVTWKLKLVSGTYRYRSDTHPKTVHGSFRVG